MIITLTLRLGPWLPCGRLTDVFGPSAINDLGMGSNIKLS